MRPTRSLWCLLSSWAAWRPGREWIWPSASSAHRRREGVPRRPGGGRYDLIISELSNTWVSGVASLFTEESYGHIKHQLERGGLLVQWLHLYENNLDLLASVVKALATHFADYAVYNTANADILVVASNDGNLSDLDPWVFEQEGLRGALRRVGDRALLGTVLEARRVPLNSDFFPYLSLYAPRARFLGEHALDLTSLHFAAIPVLEMSGARAPVAPGAAPVNGHFSVHDLQRRAERVFAAFVSPGGTQAASLPGELGEAVALLTHERRSRSGSPPAEARLMEKLLSLAAATNPYLESKKLNRLWSHLAAQPCHARLSARAQAWMALHDAVGRRDASRMAELARWFLTGGGAPAGGQQLHYLLTAGLSGAVVPGREEEARVLWRDLGARYRLDGALPLHLRLLHHLEQRSSCSAKGH